MIRTMVRLTILCVLAGFALRTNASTKAGAIPTDAKYACPMENHPDEADPANQGPYFASEPGKCPRCGMKLKPIDDLEWVRVMRAAGGSDVAYTCPDHQHVFSESPDECPRCGKALAPFKVMYTCPDPAHASIISASPGNCPQCGRGMAAYRGIWLDEKMAGANVPESPGLADVAPFRCPTHPLVHSDQPGRCTICGRELESTTTAASGETNRTSIPPKATYACPMRECWQFSTDPGECPTCGMRLKPIENVSWVNEMLDHAESKDEPAYLCPMHPNTQRSDSPGACEICGMQLVARSDFQRPHDAPSRIAAQINYITEHYLELQRLLASDKTTGVARQALGIASASEELLKHVDVADIKASAELKSAIDRLRAAALKTTGTSLEQDRVTFVELSSAMRILIDQARPDHNRWPKLYIFHCPMSKGDWVQTAADKANPYYGFKMLTCGELREVK